MNNISFRGMGVPPGYGFRQLLFSPVASVLIVQTESAGKGWRPERLYFRRAAEERYRPVGEPADLISQEYPIVHPSKPLLAYNSNKHSFSIDAQGKELHSADWDSLRVFNLELGVEVDSVNQDTIHWPTGIVRGWISSLVQFGDSGLFVCAGLSKDPSRVDYFVALVDLGERNLKPIVPLPAVFM